MSERVIPTAAKLWTDITGFPVAIGSDHVQAVALIGIYAQLERLNDTLERFTGRQAGEAMFRAYKEKER